MAYRIDKHSGFFEVHVSGSTSRGEVIEIIRELAQKDPHKAMPDMWVVAPESQVPFVCYSDIVNDIKAMFPAHTQGAPTAIVAPDGFQHARLEMYRSEATVLPYAMRVFDSRDEALSWIMEEVTRPTGSRASE
jgi:hypothetical protein